MKQKTFYFKSLLLLALMVMGVSNAWADNTYKLVKDASELSAGDVIIITSTSDGAGYALGAQATNNRTGVSLQVGYQPSNETISGLQSGVQEITLATKNNEGNYSLQVEDSKFLYAANTSSGSKNLLKVKSDEVFWSISVDGTTYSATVKDETSSCNGRNWMRFNANLFSCYASGQSDIYIFKKQTNSTPSLVDTPTLNPIAGTVESGTVVHVDNYDKDLLYFYTTDGTNPDCDENLDPSGTSVTYDNTTGISITSDVTIKMIAADIDGNKSNVITAEYTIIVPEEQSLNIDIIPNYTFFGKNAQFSGATYDELTGTKDNVTVTYTRGSGSTYANQTAMRFYKSNTLKIEAPTGFIITSVTLTASGTKNDISSSPGTWDTTNDKWEGSSTDLTLSRPSNASSYTTISNINITLSRPSSIATPTFSVEAGDFVVAQNVEINCATEGTTIYYTLDGTTPSEESSVYSSAIPVNVTTTIKAIAIKGEEKSAVASATYTFPTIYTNIAAFEEAIATNSYGYLNVDEAQVVYTDEGKKNIYLRDATGALDVYKNAGYDVDLKTGDVLSGVLYGQHKPYNGLPEIQNANWDNVSVKRNEVVVAKEITSDQVSANLCNLVKIKNATITNSGTDFFVDEVRIYNNFNIDGLTIEEGTADVQGVAAIYGGTYQIYPRFAEDIVYLGNSVAVGISSATGYATFCSEKALDFTAVDAIYAYIATVEGPAITFTRVTKIPDNTGVLLRSTEGGAVAEVNVPVLTADADDVSANKFVAATTEIASLASEDDGNVNYILNNKNGVVGFYKANDQKVAAGKAYLQVSASQAKDMTFIGLDDTTSIELMEVATGNEQMFNLAGQRVSNGYKGIVIVNGKKVIR